MKTEFRESIRHPRFAALRTRFTILCMAAALAWLFPAPAHAGEPIVARAKITHQGLSSHVLPAPDERGHVLAIGQREGTVDFDGKESAKYESTAMVDGWIGKKGIYKGYSKYTFTDGSEIFFSWTAEGARNSENLPQQQGNGVILKGTGRFKGIRGRALFTTTQLKPTADDPMRTSVADTVLVYTLP